RARSETEARLWTSIRLAEAPTIHAATKRRTCQGMRNTPATSDIQQKNAADTAAHLHLRQSPSAAGSALAVHAQELLDWLGRVRERECNSGIAIRKANG